MMKWLSRILLGVAWGCTWTVAITLITLTAGGQAEATVSVSEYTRNALLGIAIGVAFTLPTLVYDNEKLAMWQKVFIHLGIGMAVYLCAAFYAGWIPLQFGIGGILLFVLIAAVGCLLIWLGFYWYNRKKADLMNQRLKEKKNREK